MNEKESWQAQRDAYLQLQEMKKCKEDPDYFFRKYGTVKKARSIASTGNIIHQAWEEASKESYRVGNHLHQLFEYLPPWMKQNITHLNMDGHHEKAIRKANHRYAKRENRYSTAGNLLAKRRSLRKCFKKSLKKLRKDLPVGVAPIGLEAGPSHLTSLMSCLKAHTQNFDLMIATSGLSAQDVIMSGTSEIDHRRSLLENVKLPMPFGKNPIYLGGQI